MPVFKWVGVGPNGETMRGELRVLLAREARRWVEEDVPAGRTAKAHLAVARRSSRPL